ncbi:glycosyltransferase family 4 protein [Ulvibacter litoralis]|uniref:Glycosyl transferases group 1 n=1 Tax=Ulvibacter litoralis TaxID=227084 RepID=A0A1G7F8H9_9FLAO|nr:glycosyltransferase family 4 protein [Ulvibacter litoralis]GHC52216.1 glycosyl transferase family 1 [Ulvibacter litoralis]SDE72181.1 Glycosyl transferases group 1 [Ulvibacter litoralis]
MKRALIITYYWPPAGGPGVQRWLQFVRYFNDFGIEPVVFVPENPHYPLQDASFEALVPETTEILKFPVKEPYRLAGFLSKKKTKQISSGIISNKEQSVLEKTMLYVRGNFFIPDARVGWVKPSVAFLKNYISEHPVETIITSGPPHSLHLIGMELQKAFQLKWIADFRDPWTTIHYHKSLRLTKASEKKHKDLEKKVLNTADAIVVTSPTTKKEFSLLTSKPIHVITNGYVASEEMHPVLDTQFSMAHIGSLLSERNPKVLWKVLSEIASETPSFQNNLEIVLAGTISDEVFESISKFGLKDNCKHLGYVSHDEALKLQHNSQVLLLIEIDSPETRAILPGKIFEYLAAFRPILAVGPKGSDIEGILTETKSGVFYNPSEEKELKKQILQWYEAYLDGTLSVASEGVEAYSRRELTRKMAALIKQV